MEAVSKTLTALLALVALLLMPMGMAGAPAAAASPANPATVSSHCDGHGGDNGAAPAKAEQHCATCIAVPVADVRQTTLGPLPEAPLCIASVTPFLGLEPEVSTPPPKDV